MQVTFVPLIIDILIPMFPSISWSTAAVFYITLFCFFERCFLAFCSSDIENVEQQQRYEKTVSDYLQAVDSEQQDQSGRRKPALVR